MSKPIADIKDRLRIALDESGMKPIELSEKTGIAISSISQYMSGYTNPRTDRIDALAQALDVDPVWLMGFDVPMRLSTEEFSKRNAQLVALMRKDAELTQALYKYFSCDDDTKKRVVNVMNTLMDS